MAHMIDLLPLCGFWDKPKNVGTYKRYWG